MTDADGQSRTFRGTPKDISAADAWIEEVGRHWGIAERTTFRARVCVAEIAANVFEHGSPPPAEFAITLHRRGDGLDVEIIDSGRPFDLPAAARGGGWGFRWNGGEWGVWACIGCALRPRKCPFGMMVSITACGYIFGPRVPDCPNSPRKKGRVA